MCRNDDGWKPYAASHSIRVRGLKCFIVGLWEKLPGVALYTSAWIEINKDLLKLSAGRVALYTSAWIEINRK